MMLNEKDKSQDILIPKNTETASDQNTPTNTNIQSLKDLINFVSGRSVQDSIPQEDGGLAEHLPFPFLGLVGQAEMKLALILSIINPNIGGVLLIGPRGTGKTTAVRSILDLLPDVPRSTCFYGCTQEDIEAGGMDAVCPECAKKFAEGLPLTRLDKVRLVELPLNSLLADVIGGVDERSTSSDRTKLKRGLLSLADLNILYIDEINLLNNDIVDAILDASAQGSYTVRRGPVSATYRARFTLIGSMNPEEGTIRPQILDRFGLRVIVSGLENYEERWEAYQRVSLFKANPHQLISRYSAEMETIRQEIIAAKALMPNVNLPEKVALHGIKLIHALKIDSLRAEITLFEAARAYTASDARTEITLGDLEAVAPLALRLRQSKFMANYLHKARQEDVQLRKITGQIILDDKKTG